MTVKLNRCRCGRMPGVRTCRVAEDAIETWVECAGCRARSPKIEDAYADPESAAAQWNSGKGTKW
ncbi:hypothetical protein BV98_001461 [Sphingobium herbicidovorans NBRC 16415]|uniref:Uncharacterized protein n=1 Tax=Sphingobium herbicidovorans (strain ATCC 700291 / DSM 11019 / CCUG 56400 / KCTC 2939 / LMG 18315 / NBRC 16415 / MH) TaxID=1219045 RepID=A0A086PBI1_SPHHM|nr:hypothetical protein [Sphingobium herbicidovorans]KFG90749.1 hypothetical protein BV98_001461 [Sphingobium herbicidovorans NBRC 16415]